MHAGRIDNPETAAGRVYALLKAREGHWVGGWDIALQAKTDCVSTRVSEVRHQLEALGGAEAVEHEQRGRKHFYRILTAPSGQLELVV